MSCTIRTALADPGLRNTPTPSTRPTLYPPLMIRSARLASRWGAGSPCPPTCATGDSPSSHGTILGRGFSILAPQTGCNNDSNFDLCREIHHWIEIDLLKVNIELKSCKYLSIQFDYWGLRCYFNLSLFCQGSPADRESLLTNANSSQSQIFVPTFYLGWIITMYCKRMVGDAQQFLEQNANFTGPPCLFSSYTFF